MCSSIEQPLVSIIVLGYNSEPYIMESIHSALTQKYHGKIEVILSDDHSSDRTFDLMQKAVSNYNGPHKIILNRNNSNLGILAHFSHIFDRFVHGDIVLTQGGDDISFPERTQMAVDFLRDHPDCCDVSFAYDLIDAEGRPLQEPTIKKQELIFRFSKNDYFAGKFCWSGGPARAFRREVMNNFDPPIPNHGAYGEALLCYRSLCLGTIYYSNHKAIHYRKHPVSVSASARVCNRASIMEGVYRQIFLDVEQAHKNGFLSTDECHSFKNAVEREKLYNKFRVLYEQSGLFGRSVIIPQILLSPFLRCRQKFVFLKNIVLYNIKTFKWCKSMLKTTIQTCRNRRTKRGT